VYHFYPIDCFHFSSKPIASLFIVYTIVLISVRKIYYNTLTDVSRSSNSSHQHGFICLLVFSFLVIISFIKLILLKIRVRNVKFQIYEWQRSTGSDAFHYFYETRHWQWRVCFLYIQNAQRLSISLARGLDETRHWQWRAAIRIFEILQFSLLFLIILI
jgi:hypothetical protein